MNSTYALCTYDENLHIMCSQSFYIIHTLAKLWVINLCQFLYCWDRFFLHEINILRVFAMFQNIIDENIYKKKSGRIFVWFQLRYI